MNASTAVVLGVSAVVVIGLVAMLVYEQQQIAKVSSEATVGRIVETGIGLVKGLL